LGHEVLTPGKSMWLCRFSPDTVGTWSFQVNATEFGNNSASTQERTFTVVKGSSSLGFIRISEVDPTYFQYEGDGSTYFPIGENLCWAKDTFDYDRYLAKLFANNVTYIRIWMSDNMFNVESKETGLGTYAKTQDQAWRLDYVVDVCNKYNIAILLCFNYAAQYDSNGVWNYNPYNVANGGMLSSPDALWTNNAASAYYDRRYRYIAARWSYATNLLAWELWNEVDDTQNFQSHINDVTQWHSKFYTLMRNYDPHRHIITTSFGTFPGIKSIHSLMDYIQIHNYGASDMTSMAISTVTYLESEFPNKPVLVAEYGTDWNWNNPGLLTNDKIGINMHNEQWGSLMAKASGGGYSWWWDNIIDPDNQYYHYKGISSFVAGEDLIHQAYKRISVVSKTSVNSDANISPALQWGVKPPSNRFTLNPDGTLTPDVSSLSELQYGVSAHPDLRNPPTFIVNFLEEGQFSMNIIEGSPTGARVQVSLDGKVVTDRPLASGALNVVLEFPVPAGKHEIFVDSIASDWYQVNSFTFTHCTFALETYAIQGKSKVLGWAKNREHTWWMVKNNHLQPVISDGVVSLDICSSTSMSWNVEWWDTTAGKVSARETAHCSCNAGKCDPLSLQVPKIDSSNFDWGFKLLQ